jgi:alpha-glucosidase
MANLEAHFAAFALGCTLAAACTGTDQGSARPDSEAGTRDVGGGAESGGSSVADAASADGSMDASRRDAGTDEGDRPHDDVRDVALDAWRSDAAADADGAVPPRDAATGDADSEAGTPPTVDIEQPCRADLALRVTVLDDHCVRLHYVRSGAPSPERGWVFDTRGFGGPTSIVVDKSAARLSVTTAALAIEVSGDACSLAIRDRAGAVLWQEAAPYRADAAGAASLGRRLDEGEHIYGLGEKTGVSERRGRSFEMWNSDPAWSDPTGQYRTVTDPIYQSHPFFLSLRKGGRATGTFLANTHRTGFDVGKTTLDALALSAHGGDIDLFFFDGPAPAAVLERYTRLVGRPFLPPLWTLGYHQSRWSYASASRVEEVAAEFRRRALPADGMWLDIDYMDGFRDFTWNPNTFADPSGLMSRLAGRGFKVTAILDPGVKSEPGGRYAAYNAGIANRHFILGADQNPVVCEVWPGASVFPDFTREGTRQWWGDLVGDFSQSSGLRGTWIDMNEPAVFSKDDFPLDARVDGEGAPTAFAEVKNVYALLMARATYEGSQRASPDRRPFILTRAGFAGIQRYAAVWTGDAQSTWDHLAMTPSMLAGMSVSGMAFVGSDIGGFSGSPAPELYGRWFEVGSLSPFFRSHVATGAPDQEPWSFGSEIESVARRMLALRYTLLPYWYQQHAAAARTGAPIVRPLWFEFPGDEQASRHDDEFFIGPSLLAAPVTAANVTARDVYLPAGTFYDYYTGASYQGPATVNLPAALGRVPLLVRAGAILPTQDVVEYVGAPSSGKIYLDVFPGTVGSSTSTDLYEDDGDTNAHAAGAFATAAVSSSVSTTGLTLDIAAPVGAFTTTATAVVVRVHGVASRPSAVLVDGAAVTPAYEPGTRVVTVPAQTPGAAHTVVIAYDAATPPSPRQVNVDLTLAIPASTPAGDIYVASSALAWQPNGLRLTRSGNTATGRLTVLEGTLLKWKATRGTWATVEATATCGDLPNREIIADYGASGTSSAQVTVATWVDHCP